VDVNELVGSDMVTHPKRLLRDFNDSLFTCHPSEELRLEDIRLQELADLTKAKVAAGWCMLYT
jgi:hypothetical protein